MKPTRLNHCSQPHPKNKHRYRNGAQPQVDHNNRNKHHFGSTLLKPTIDKIAYNQTQQRFKKVQRNKSLRRMTPMTIHNVCKHSTHSEGYRERLYPQESMGIYKVAPQATLNPKPTYTTVERVAATVMSTRRNSGS